MNRDKLTQLAVLLLALTGVLLVNNHVLTKRITAKVVDSLKRDYVPGPYEPGFDPDKVPAAPK